ncbi:hypothetical protein RvY_18309 [Ramazzottius varieornatus]|uniref:Protein kinase domain-containing protein n=1 Tax=Ramazzottius varieornatus TaxID=947166 RepID=A0A1D1W594_RAMVA|nr:hypothetical protein RvY_18309 [Ramazzottius varieornatus]
MEDLDRAALQERRFIGFELSGEFHSGQPGVYVHSSIDIATRTPIAVNRHFDDTDKEKQNAQVNVVKHLGFQRELPNPTQKMAVQTSPSPEEFQKWSKHLLLGIQYLHEKEIVHKDTASCKLFLSCIKREESILRIGDFDRSQRLQSHDTLPNGVTFGGSINTMAPQMLAKHGFGSTDLHVGRKSDIFSVGWVVTEMMQSTLMFPVLLEDDYGSVASLFAEYILQGGRAAPPVNCCAEIKELLDSCLQKDPDKRREACELLELSFFRVKPQVLRWMRRVGTPS